MTKPAARQPYRLVIIGVGNEHRGDDAVGLAVARWLQEAGLDGATVLTQSGEGTALLEAWQDADAVILIDAVQSGPRPGTIHRLEAHEQPAWRTRLRGSTHTFGVAEAIELARALHQLPAHVVVYGVTGHTFDIGSDMSADVTQAIPEVVARVRHEVTILRTRG